MNQPLCLGYCVFEVSDLDAWQQFATRIVGVPAKPQPGGLALRMDERAYRVLLIEGVADDILAAGWEFTNQSALESYVSDLRERGVQVNCGDDLLLGQRQVDQLYWCKDPNGWRHEFYSSGSIASSTEGLVMPLVPGGFVSGRLGVGHIVSVARDAEQTNRYYQDILNFAVSDYISASTELIADTRLDITFYHVGSGRHHSIAVSEIPGFPKCMNHIMLEMHRLTDVGMAYDRFLASEAGIVSSIGQHPNDQMTSFYAMTPSGFAIEIGYGGVVIDDDSWPVHRYCETSIWGHKAM